MESFAGNVKVQNVVVYGIPKVSFGILDYFMKHHSHFLVSGPVFSENQNGVFINKISLFIKLFRETSAEKVLLIGEVLRLFLAIKFFVVLRNSIRSVEAHDTRIPLISR